MIKVAKNCPVAFQVADNIYIEINQEGSDVFSFRALKTVDVDGVIEEQDIPCEYELNPIPGDWGSQIFPIFSSKEEL